MVDFVEIDENKIVYCTLLHDGRIEKFLLKREKIILYVCEECDATWISVRNIFEKEKMESLIPYIKSIGYTEKINKRSWAEISDGKGFLKLDDIRDIVEEYNIDIVHI